jgi:hypothetical protein
MRTVNSKSWLFRPLSALILLIVLAALFLSGVVEAFTKDCDDGCHDDCTSDCGCINCLPSLVIIDIAHSDHASLPVILPWSASDFFLELEQEWFNSIDHPPQNSH